MLSLSAEICRAKRVLVAQVCRAKRVATHRFAALAHDGVIGTITCKLVSCVGYQRVLANVPEAALAVFCGHRRVLPLMPWLT